MHNERHVRVHGKGVSGRILVSDDSVEVHVHVGLAMMMLRGDNQVVLFDSWYQRQPLVIALRPELMGGAEPTTLPGIFEGLPGARVGGTRVITMPAEVEMIRDGICETSPSPIDSSV